MKALKDITNGERERERRRRKRRRRRKGGRERGRK